MEAEGRQLHIDALRGVAVALMVMVHAAATWNPSSASRLSPLAYIVSGLGGLAAPLFVTLLGWGLMKTTLSFHQRWTRALFLFACQFLVNISAPHLFEPFTPGILSLMGVLVVSEPLWARPFRAYRNPVMPFLILSALCSSIILLFPELQGESIWSIRVQTPNATTALSHLLLTGTYPLFPWVLFAALGGMLQRMEQQELTHFYAASITFGLIFSGLTLAYSISTQQAWALPSGDAVLTFFPSNAPFLVAAMTGVLILWSSSPRLLSRATVLAQSGRTSLTVYVAHFIPLALFHTVDQTNNWSLTQSSLVVLTYTIGWIVFGALWHKIAPKITLEYFMRTLGTGTQSSASRPSKKLE